MSENTKAKKTCEISLPKVLREELNHIKPANSHSTNSGQQNENLNDVFKDFHDAKLSGLCFSGGGIRSATFGLGIVQALAKHRLLDKFDYLSTVSGGGYLGSWLSAWIRREQLNKFEAELIGYEIKLNEVKKREVENNAQKNDTEISKLNKKIVELNEQLFEVYKIKSSAGVEIVQEKLNAHSIPDSDSTCPNIEPKQLQYLRQYSNYMSPRVGLLSADTWTLLGIYTRNLFLNWTIFIPLISAFLLIPRFFLAFTHLIAINKWITFSMLPIGFIAGSLAVAFVVNKLPSKNTDTLEIKHNTDGWILAGGILPLLILAFTTTTFWAWYHLPGTVPESYYNFFQPYSKYEAANFTVFMVSIFLFGYLIFHFTKRPRVKLDGRGILAAFFSSVIGGFVLWMVAHNLFEGDFFFKSQDNPNILLLYVCIAVPVFLLVFLIAATIFVGLSSMFVTDDDREWLARFGAWLLIFTGAWSVLNGLVLFGPIGLQYTISAIENLLPGGNNNLIDYVSPIVPLIAAISGLLSLGGGFSGKSPVRDELTKSRLSKFLSIAPRIAAVVFLAFVFVGLAYLSSIVLALTGNFFNELFDRRIVGLAFTTDSHLDVLYQSSIGYLLCWLIGLSIIGIGMAFFVNVNKFSLHGAYRDRLIRAYLGASHVNRKGSAFTGFDETDNFQLHRLRGQKPFHIINATLNLIDGKNLAWQDRKAASFTMSPLHCGNWLLGYRYTNEYSRNPNLPNCVNLRFCNQRNEPCLSVEGDNCKFHGKALRLGTAMAISGAAANPNMGYYSSPVVTFLMSLFNIRLGWWLGNTGKIGDRKDWWGKDFYTKPSPSIAVLPLLNETLGRTDENKRYLNVTDGGHFENLGLYEMILRRCRLIILSDAAADENFTFSEISNAIEKCKVDLGVDIKFNDGINIYSRHTAKDQAGNKNRFAVAEILYPETDQSSADDKSYLLYIRPTFYGNEPTDIKNYANLNNTFPHQSTSDQLYDEKQFEAYRALGFFIMEEIIKTESLKNLFNLLKKANDSTTKNTQSDLAQPLPDLLRPESSDAV